jgi:hypothetical protein
MIPSWISDLHDTALKADFTSFYNAGPITEAEMAEALGDLVSENIVKNQFGETIRSLRLSARQLSDLQSIAGNIGSIGASQYLEFITDAFVNGNAANAAWSGGNATSTPLGNLDAGYSMAKFNELIGKWFGGADLPSDIISYYHSSGHDWTNGNTITYSTVDEPLYGPGGPSMSDINQGSLADCYFLSSLAEVAFQDPSAITSMITDNGNGTYGVRFYVDGAARYVTVDSQLPDGGTQFNHSSVLWASLVETAYAEVQQQGAITNAKNRFEKDFPTADLDNYSTIANDGSPPMRSKRSPARPRSPILRPRGRGGKRPSSTNRWRRRARRRVCTPPP